MPEDCECGGRGCVRCGVSRLVPVRTRDLRRGIERSLLQKGERLICRVLYKESRNTAILQSGGEVNYSVTCEHLRGVPKGAAGFLEYRNTQYRFIPFKKK